VLLLQNEAGYRNLLRLVSQSYLAGGLGSSPKWSFRRIPDCGARLFGPASGCHAVLPREAAAPHGRE
jgi:DNA polymerase III alpha subunit